MSDWVLNTFLLLYRKCYKICRSTEIKWDIGFKLDSAPKSSIENKTRKKILKVSLHKPHTTLASVLRKNIDEKSKNI